MTAPTRPPGGCQHGAARAVTCRCRYPACCPRDLDEHVEAMVALADPADHGERG